MGDSSLLVPMAGLLDDHDPRIEHLALTLDLKFERPLQRAERVHVLHLDLGAKDVAPLRTQRDVGVESDAPLLEPGVGCTHRQHQRPELLGVGACQAGRLDVRLGHDLGERHTGPVEVEKGASGGVDTTAGADVDALPGVLFHMRTVDPDSGGGALHFDLEMAAPAHRDVVLRDLKILWHVGVEVVLAMEHRAGDDLALQR